MCTICWWIAALKNAQDWPSIGCVAGTGKRIAIGPCHMAWRLNKLWTYLYWQHTELVEVKRWPCPFTLKRKSNRENVKAQNTRKGCRELWVQKDVSLRRWRLRLGKASVKLLQNERFLVEIAEVISHWIQAQIVRKRVLTWEHLLKPLKESFPF